MKSDRSKKLFLIFLGISVLIFGWFGSSAGEVGVTDTTIKIGSIYDTTGITAHWGLARTEAHRAYLNYINDQGGINGRKIIQVHENDEYKPSRTVLSYKKLLDVDKVFCFISGWGAPTTDAVVPIAEKNKVPYIFFSGNNPSYLWPVRRYIFPIWPLYEDYPRILVDYIAKDLKMKNAKIAYLAHVGPSGRATKRGLEYQMAKYPGMKILASDLIKYGQVDMGPPVYKMRQANPDVLLIFTVLTHTAKILKEMQKVGWKPSAVMLNPSSGDPKLMKLAGAAAEGVMLEFVFPMVESEMPGVKFYKDVCRKYLPNSKINPSQAGIVGFIEMQLGLEAIKRSGRNLTREGLIDTLENSFKNVDLQSIPPVTYSPEKHWGLNQNLILKVEGGKFKQLTDWRAPEGGEVQWKQ
ncbi:ABC transporter substrate-binding protein [Thermodesulfobacteriota bacterium]